MPKLSRGNTPKFAMKSVATERIQLVFQKLERDLVKLASKQTAASVHNFRTGASRLQNLFDQLLPERDRNQKKLGKMLRRLRKRAGEIRDLDVQLAALRSLKVTQEPRRKTQLMQALIELRAKDEVKLRKELTKETVREFRKRLKRAGKELALNELRDPLQTAKQTLSEAALPDGPMTEEQLHRQRIVTKHARYIAEFAPKSAEADRLIAQLKRVQAALGDWHDWLLLTQTSTARLGDIHQSPLVAVLHNLTGAKFRRAVSALPATPNAFRQNAKRSPARKPEMGVRKEGIDSSASSAPAISAA